jgi:nitroimidazol reductase NimA-like FMN-containing flavoprotein (pyridoxamine 5'-phosphate oxidase superfamily)
MTGSDSTGSVRRGSESTGHGIPQGQASSSGEPATPHVEELQTAECWRLLETTTFGRLAVDGLDGRPDLFPVNFLVRNGNVFIRSAAGAKLASIITHPAVAFEIDGETEAFRWSVVMRGAAQRLTNDSEIEASGIRGLVTSHPSTKYNYVRITPDTVTGRRFRTGSQPAPRPSGDGAAVSASDQEEPALETGPTSVPRRGGKPESIPHYAPPPED